MLPQIGLSLRLGSKCYYRIYRIFITLESKFYYRWGTFITLWYSYYTCAVYKPRHESGNKFPRVATNSGETPECRLDCQPGAVRECRPAKTEKLITTHPVIGNRYPHQTGKTEPSTTGVKKLTKEKEYVTSPWRKNEVRRPSTWSNKIVCSKRAALARSTWLSFIANILHWLRL